MADKIAALLVGHRKLWQEQGGGVQICNREYVSILEAAGFSLTPVPFEFGLRWSDRFFNRLAPKLAIPQVPPGLFASVRCALAITGAEFVFFSLNLFSTLSRDLKRAHPRVRQVLLSHGAESVDFCIEQRIRRRAETENRRRFVAERMLGRELMDEVEQRRWLDGVLTLSPFEVEIEKWLGSRRIMWVPRTIHEPPLDPRPVNGRVGCVSTLEHPPNLDGLIALCDQLARRVPADFRFRIVGQPAHQGAMLADRYPFVDYLGPLSDSELQAEAATWCCFVHPMFVYAKGCSMKLAVALGWGLPITTTEFGARGYLWDEKLMPLARSPAQLAQLVVERSAIGHFALHRSRTVDLVARTPDAAAVGDRVREFLCSHDPAWSSAYA